MLDEVSKQVKSEYNKFLKTGAILPGPSGRHYKPSDEEIYEDHIVTLDITSEARKFYKDENVKFVVSTKAQKHINVDAKIYCFIDGSAFYDFHSASMNARIQYTINSGAIKPGTHTVKFEYYKSGGDCLSSEEVAFEIVNEMTPEKRENSPSKSLDLNISIVDAATLICEVARDTINKKIDVKLCLDSDQLRSEVYGISASSDEISKIKNRIIKPLALFSLFLGDSYDNIEKDEDKNNLMISYIKAFVGSVDSKIVEVM